MFGYEKVKAVSIERVHDGEVVIQIFRPGEDDVTIRLFSGDEIFCDVSYELKSADELAAARFEILRDDTGPWYLIDHRKDEPYPTFKSAEEAEKFRDLRLRMERR